MSCEGWKIQTLESICDLIPGFAFKSSHFGDYKSKVIKIADIQPPYVNDKDLTGVDIEPYKSKNLKKYIANKGDFVLAMTGATIGKVGKVLADKLFINQRILLFKPKKEYIDSRFLYYYIQRGDFQRYILNHIDSETAQPNISGNSVGKYPIRFPFLEEQKRIADILLSFDDKIELNNKINANLEQQAQAIFKSWFVDFDPFQDGEFVDSELGMIPKGWRIGCIGDFGEIICGKTPSKAIKEYFGGKHMFIKIPDMHNSMFVIETIDSLTDAGWNSQVNKIVPPYSICVSSIATVGLVCINPIQCQTNQQINCIVPKQNFMKYYVYFLALLLKDFFVTIASGGTATLNMNTSQFSKIKVVIPSNDILISFDEIVSPSINRILNNEYENKSLIQIRDTLLPKLMSGEIEV